MKIIKLGKKESMMPKHKLFLFLAILVLAALACDISLPELPSDPAEPDAGAVATAVALTLAASEGGGPPEEPPAGPPDDVLLGPPSVLRVAYVDDSDLWLWTEGGTAVELHDNTLAVGDLRLSDDGQVVAFLLLETNSLPNSIMSINTDGSGLRTLVDTATLSSMTTDPIALAVGPHQMEFVPGTHVLAFNSQLYFDGPGLIIENDLQNVDTDTGILTTIVAPGAGGRFHYSPDGTQAAIVTPTNISIMNANGSNWRAGVLTYTSVITYTEAPFFANPRWSADSSQLRVVIPSADILDPGAIITVYDLPLDGSPAVSLGSTASQAPLFRDEPTLSPDMSTVAFTREMGAPGSTTIELHFVEPATGITTFYHSAAYVNFENWSPNGTHFVFAEGGSRYLGELGAGFGPVAGLSDVRRVVWVDATRFLFTNGSIGAFQLQLGSIGGTTVLIVAPVGDFIAFDFSN